MSSDPENSSDHSSPAEVPEVRFASNDVRLSPRNWMLVVALVGLLFWLLPAAWNRLEPIPLGPDYRIPYSLSSDYWNYARTCRAVSGKQAFHLVGDSVVWGHYVDSHHTLSHFLNEQTGRSQFTNLGVDGIHCVALAGLVQYYGKALAGQHVIVNCNLMWMSSPRHDLSIDKETLFNHPTLVPQFIPSIPCYKASLSERLGVVCARKVQILQWADHLRITYFGSSTLASWTIDNPYRNPLSQITLVLPSPDELPSPMPDARPWTEKQIRPLTPNWVPLGDSLQWRFFCQTVRDLQKRRCHVCVAITPLNEHMFTDVGVADYRAIIQQVIEWHAAEGIPCCTPQVLPSEMYADLSHPTASGYALLARELLSDPAFRRYISK